MKIEDACQSDFSTIFVYLLAFFGETEMGPVDERDLASWLDSQIKSEKSKVLVVRNQGQIVALFMGAVAPHLFNRQRSYAFDWVLYVVPEYRHISGKPICRVIEVFEEWARQSGADEVILALVSPARSRLERFLVSRHQYKFYGVMMKKGL